MIARTAIITGGARGLGLAVATALQAEGYGLLLVDRDASVEATAEKLAADGAVAACVADITDPRQVQTVRAAAKALGGVDALVNNAGITRDARLARMTPEQFSAVITVNLVGPMLLTSALTKELHGGASIVNMSSRAALGNFGQANYSASKSGLVGYTRGLAIAWSPRVRVNAVAPGLIDSAMTRAMPAEVLDGLVAKVPLARIGTPEDVARAVAFLCSPSAAFITGQVLTVCGGRSIAP
ncbi:SDR family oxidoreductase [Salinibacterium sp. ZJ454]|uniref:SDR family oxidoreductase n=1 Tax=Salinibacterium sp. ZJ454 TaxID=2708339 RepID=UPI001AB04B50|nr:SDR family oxidoreductase [Salinibacterium sp. ZJ454]